jgi:hypothetical protein
MTEDDEATSTRWSNGYIAYVSLLGATIALTFDVGCFSEIGINFFTLFSLSEHLVFAIQALPIALVLLIALSAFAVLFGAKPRPPRQDFEMLSKRRRIVGYVIGSFLILGLLSYVGFLLYKNPEMLLVVIPIAILGFGLLTLEPTYKPWFTAFMAIYAANMVAFLLGYYVGAAYLSKDDISKGLIPAVVDVVDFKDGASIKARIIRSGDRGVLLYDPASDRVRFVLWDTISSIEATPAESTNAKRQILGSPP